MKKYLLIAASTLVLLVGCVTKPKPASQEYVIKIDSPVPVSVSVYKDCKDNWNFCEASKNWNFYKFDKKTK